MGNAVHRNRCRNNKDSNNLIISNRFINSRLLSRTHRKLIADVREHGTGVNYLIQHSAGSGKSNSIAWTAYRLASLHDEFSKPVFSSVIIVADRTVLDRQLQDTISSFDHTLGTVETIGEGKTSKDLRDAINNGSRIIVTTLQKFPVIYTEVVRLYLSGVPYV